MTLFDHLKNITEIKNPWSSLSEEDKKTYNNFMINKYLSMNKDYIDIVNTIQKYNLPPGILHDLYCQLIPKKKVWLKFIKSENKESANKSALNNLASYFECSIREAEIYFYIADKDELSDIFEAMGIDKKEIKKILK